MFYNFTINRRRADDMLLNEGCSRDLRVNAAVQGRSEECGGASESPKLRFRFQVSGLLA